MSRPHPLDMPCVLPEDGWRGVHRQAVIGTDGMEPHTDPTEPDWNNSGQGTAPEDWVEGEDEAVTLEPQSLYEDQLTRRMGR